MMVTKCEQIDTETFVFRGPHLQIVKCLLSFSEFVSHDKSWNHIAQTMAACIDVGIDSVDLRRIVTDLGT